MLSVAISQKLISNLPFPTPIIKGEKVHVRILSMYACFAPSYIGQQTAIPGELYRESILNFAPKAMQLTVIRVCFAFVFLRAL